MLDRVIQFFHFLVFLYDFLLHLEHLLLNLACGLGLEIWLRLINRRQDVDHLLQSLLHVVESDTLPPILAHVGRQLLPLVLNLADLPDELVGEHVDELAELLPDAQEHIPNVVLPVRYRALHPAVLHHCLLRHRLDLIELLERALIALINEMNLFFVDETFDASVRLYLLLPEVERHAVIRTNLDGLAIRLPKLVILPGIVRAHSVNRCHHIFL